MNREGLRKILRGKCVTDEACEEAIDELLNLYSVSSCIAVGDEVLYVGHYVGRAISEDDVKLRDGTIVCSLRSQPQKFRKII